MIIDRPGIYRDVDPADYHADCCPAPSLNQSTAKVLIERSPLHAKMQHPRLTPVQDDEADPEKYDKAKAIGNAAHALMLGRGKTIGIIEHDDFRSKAAKEARQQALAAGVEPVLAAHYEAATEMVTSARAQIALHEADDAFRFGSAEAVLVWQEDGLWFRTMIDWLHDDLLTIDDFKTSGLSAAPHGLGYMMVNAGWDVQAAMFERGLDILDPKNAGRRRFRFIVQENQPPFALSVVQLGEGAMTMGRKKLQTAVDIWKRCIATNTWPGYVPRVITPEYPGFKESQWLERELTEFSGGNERDARLIMAG